LEIYIKFTIFQIRRNKKTVFLLRFMENQLAINPAVGQLQQISQQLTAAQLQSLNILAAPLQELARVLATELENNPLLEIISPGSEELAGDPIGAAAEESNNLSVSEFEGDREDFPLLENLQNIWEDSAADDYNLSFDEVAEHRKRSDFVFNNLTAAPTLVDMLTEQLDYCQVTPKEKAAAELVIGSLDEQGFLTTHPADIAMAGDLTLPEVDAAIKLVQSFDPPGIGARNGAESLILQLRRQHYPNERIYTLLECYQTELERNKLPQIARAMNVDIEEIYAMLSDLKKLNVIPAAGLGNSSSNVIAAPEMSIELVNGELLVSTREQYLPKLGLVGSYIKLLENPETPADTRQYLQEKLANAENLLRAMESRQDTLTRITQVIARKQADFFRRGIAFLQPMTMQEVAKELDLHETTVSRAVAGKYLDTPQGLKEYRFFFSGGYKNADGEDISSRGVKALIQSFIDEEDPRKPLSDQKISQKLSEHGLDVARRTVAKYRESMNIAPTNLRRRH